MTLSISSKSITIRFPLSSIPKKPSAKGSPKLYDNFADNVAYRWELEGGDVAGAFKKADKIIKQRMVNQRLIPMAMEPRGVVADFDAGEPKLTIWTSTQIPHLVRTQLGVMLGFSETSIHLITPEVGGGFGSKLNVYAEEALCAFMAMKIGKPVKWIESRRENFQATIHGRDFINYVELAVKRDGTILGARYKIIGDLGAYFQLLTPLIPTLTALMLCGSYKIPAVRIEIVGALTNKMATDAYRGAGRPEATYFIERAMDIVAAELKKDPLEIRRKNFPKPKDFPYATPTGLIYDTANYQGCLEAASKKSAYAKLRKEQAAARKAGQACRHRCFQLRRDLRHGPLERHASRRLGERHRPHRAHRQSENSHRLLASRPGPGNQLCPDWRRHAWHHA